MQGRPRWSRSWSEWRESNPLVRFCRPSPGRSGTPASQFMVPLCGEWIQISGHGDRKLRGRNNRLDAMVTPRPLPLDPIEEAHRQWAAHGWGEVADGMAAVT